MFFGLPDEAVALREGVRDVLRGACGPEVVRASWDDDTATLRLWAVLGDLGLPGLLVPQPSGGLGADELVAVAALEEAGWAGVPGPLVETVAAGAPLLAAAGSPVLEDVLGGRARTALQRGDGVVPHAAASEVVLQVRDGLRLLTRAEAEPQSVATVDGSRHAARVRAEGEALAVDGDLLDLAVQRATLGTAAFLLGLARRQLDLTVGYVRERRQFGVAIGSFQAVKHPLADAAVGTEFAWPAVLRAGHSLATGDPEASLHVSMAKALASDAAHRMSRVCLQAHGAMAYTLEYDLQLFAKRTWAMARDWGTSTDHRARIAAHLGLEETPVSSR